jgi:hypothetical protein
MLGNVLNDEPQIGSPVKAIELGGADQTDSQLGGGNQREVTDVLTPLVVDSI